MKAHLRSARIAPKKANVIATMVRGMPVPGALEALRSTHKKGARMVEQLLRSAVANAEHNDRQDPSRLVVKSIVVNQGAGLRRGVPMARGRMRPMTKFLSHISLTLGIADNGDAPPAPPRKAAARTPSAPGAAKKKTASPSQAKKNAVQKTAPKAKPSSSSSSASTPS